MEYLTKELFNIATLERVEVERKLNEIRQTLTADNSRVALCGNCRYNDEMETIYRYTCYPYCECQLTSNCKCLMICYSPENKEYKYSYARELESKCMLIIEMIKRYKSTLKWYNFRTKLRAEKAITQLYIYMFMIVEFISKFNLRKESTRELGVSTPFSYPEPPRNI